MTVKLSAWNIHGLRSKQHDALLHEIVNKNDVICLSETWLSENNTFNIPGYQALSKYRYKKTNVGRPSGGLTVLIKNELQKKNKTG